MRSIAKSGSNESLYAKVIIVNYDKGWPAKCLPSVVATQYSSSRFGIIIVDNASGNALASIRNPFGTTRLVRLDKNVGYANTVNIGLENSSRKYVAVLNNDVSVFPACATSSQERL